MIKQVYNNRFSKCIVATVETDEAIEFNKKNVLTRLNYEYTDERFMYNVKALELSVEDELRFIMFPGVISCHIIFGLDREEESFWFSHISANQVSSQIIPDYLKKPPPPYSQLLAENYNNIAAIQKRKKIDFYVVDKMNSFNGSRFCQALGNRVSSINLINPPIVYSDTSVFIFFDINRKIFYFVTSPFSESILPSSSATLQSTQTRPPGYINENYSEKSTIADLTDIILGKVSSNKYEILAF